MQFDIPQHPGSPIKVIGVGGGGSNAVNYMHQQGINGVDFIVCNTDNQALEASTVPTRIQLGTTLTAGPGAGSIPETGKNAAIENLDDVLAHLNDNATNVGALDPGKLYSPTSPARVLGLGIALGVPADPGINIRIIQSGRPYMNQNLSNPGFRGWSVSYKPQHFRTTVSYQLISSHVFGDRHHRASLLICQGKRYAVLPVHWGTPHSNP